ncbi:MAG: helix-turn-helix domain-containing protein [Gemmatimonadales bacterium]
MDATSGLLTPRELADLLKVSEPTAWRLGREGRVPTIRIGRLMRFDRRAIAAWLAANGSVGREPAPAA